MSQSWPPPGATPPPPGSPQPGPPGPPVPSGPAGSPGSTPYDAAPGGPADRVPRQPPPYLTGAAHKPGAVPLRPLGLGDIYDAAFRVIRHNPAATVGAAVVVAAAAMVLPLLVVGLLSASSELELTVLDADGSNLGDTAVLLRSFGPLVPGLVLQWLGNLLVTGMIVQVVMGAAVGRLTGLGEAWASIRGTRLRLVLLVLVVGLLFALPTLAYTGLWVVVAVTTDTALLVVWGLVSVPAFLTLSVWLYVRVVRLAVPALVVERAGVLGALRRALQLSRRQFWRILGISLLTSIITVIAAQVLTTPVSLVLQALLAGIDPQYAVFVVVAIQALTSVIATAFVTPFTAAVTSLQYLDQRMRKEAFDVELMQRAGITGR